MKSFKERLKLFNELKDILVPELNDKVYAPKPRVKVTYQPKKKK